MQHLAQPEFWNQLRNGTKVGSSCQRPEAQPKVTEGTGESGTLASDQLLSSPNTKSDTKNDAAVRGVATRPAMHGRQPQISILMD
jgi:hypothetical protein